MQYLIALRVDELGNKDTLAIFSDLIQTRSDCYLISRETAAKTKKIHYHAQVKLESHLKIETVKKNFRIDMRTKLGLVKHQFYCSEVKDIKDHTTYIMKELEVSINNWDDQEFIEDCLKETVRINIEKKLKMKHQLLIYAEANIFTEEKVIDILVNNNAAAVNINDLYIEIINYHIDRDYLPPSRTLLTQYAAFIICKLFEGSMVAKICLLEIYNI